MSTFANLFNRGAVRPTDWDLFCLGLLAQIAYYPADQGVHLWADAMGVPAWQRWTTPQPATPNVVFAGTATQLVIAVSGTENAGQMINNINQSWQRAAGDFGDGQAHDFFLWCAETIVDFVKDKADLFPSLQEVVLVGHSLGGAVAQLLADWITKKTPLQVKLCVTFNSPRVGNTDWANMIRPYSTWLVYNTRDMVCELPLPIQPVLAAQLLPEARAFRYEHRETQIPVDSVISLSALSSGVGLGLAATPTSSVGWMAPVGMTLREARQATAAAFRVAGLAVVAVTLPLSFGVAISEHRMTQLLNRMRNTAQGTNTNEFELVSILADIVIDNAIFTPAADNAGGFLAPARYFLTDVPPPAGTLPTPTTPVNVESCDASVAWAEAAAIEPGPNLIDSNWQAFADSAVRTVAPAMASDPAVMATVDVSVRPNRLFNGKDRRLILKLFKGLLAIQDRDWKAAFGGLSSAISTRDVIFNDDDQVGVEHLLLALAEKLSLYYSPTP